MRTSLLAVVVLVAGASSAFATETFLPNGSFEVNNPAGGFTQTIDSWTPSFVGSSPIPANQQSGLFTTFGKFSQNSVPDGTQFLMMDNLGGGTVRLDSVVFPVVDRRLEFRYVYMTNHAPGDATHDNFFVRVDFFSDAAGNNLINTTGNVLVADRGTFDDTNFGASPFATGSLFTFNNAAGETWNHTFVNIDLGNTFGAFARVSFIVDDNNNAPTATEGLGVSGILLDRIILTPEPTTLGLFLAGAAGLGGLAWRRRRAAKIAPPAA